MITKILLNDFSFIIIDMAIGCIMAFTAILAYGKTKKITSLFFVLSALFLYISMIFRVLEKLNVFILSDYLVMNLPIYQSIVDYIPMLLLTVGFIVLLNER